MRVAILAAEAVPYSKTGGLGDVAGALPKALCQIGVDAVLITPLYRQTKGEYLHKLAIDDLWVNWRGAGFRAKAFYSEANGSPTFLIDAPEYFHRDSIYGYTEDYERFAFFNHAALSLLERIGAPPDIVHLNDWHCGFAAVEIALKRRRDDYWRNARTVFSIHNLAYQGAFGMDELSKLGFGDDFSRNAFSFDGAASALKAGLADSDMLSTVSRRYGYEIQQSENGYGLDWLLRQRSDRLFGIVNGVDYDVWNPATDPLLPERYDAETVFEHKPASKAELQKRFALPVDPTAPVLGLVSRLVSQKGIDLILSSAPGFLDLGCQLVFLGDGDREFHDQLRSFRDKHPTQVGVYLGFQESLAHLVEAGSDLFLMPSRYEPSGLNQLYSLKYGTPPVVRATGGLADTIVDANEASLAAGTGTGFSFAEYTPSALYDTVKRAVTLLRDRPEDFRRVVGTAMHQDWSWERSAAAYEALYRKLLAG